MVEKFLKKIIAQSPDDLRVISALCSGAKIKQTEIKFLKENKIFLIFLTRENKENIESTKKIDSILKFEFIETSKSKNIDQNSKDNILELLAIESFKRENSYEIVILFSNNGIITLFCEIIECTLEDVKSSND